MKILKKFPFLPFIFPSIALTSFFGLDSFSMMSTLNEMIPKTPATPAGLDVQ